MKNKKKNNSIPITPDLQLEVAQKDIQISQLNDQLRMADEKLFNQDKQMQKEITQLKESLESERKRIVEMEKQLKNAPSLSQFNEMKNKLEVLEVNLAFQHSFLESLNGGCG